MALYSCSGPLSRAVDIINRSIGLFSHDAWSGIRILTTVLIATTEGLVLSGCVKYLCHVFHFRERETES